MVALLEAVPGLVLAGHHAVRVDGGDHRRDGLLAVGVVALEGVAKVVEDL